MTYIRRKFLSLFCYFKVQIFRQLSVGQSSSQTHFKTFWICQCLGFKTLHWGVAQGETSCPTRPTKCKPCPALPRENWQNLRGGAVQSWIQSIEIQYVNRKESKFSWYIFASPKNHWMWMFILPQNELGAVRITFCAFWPSPLAKDTLKNLCLGISRSMRFFAPPRPVGKMLRPAHPWWRKKSKPKQSQ